MTKGSKTKNELVEALKINPHTLITRMRAIGIEASDYVDLGHVKVAVYSPQDVKKITASLKEKPILKRGWPKGLKRGK